MATAVPSLLGRDAELSAVDAAPGWLEAREGGFCAVGGEPGIGKSRLEREVGCPSGYTLSRVSAVGIRTRGSGAHAYLPKGR